MFACPPTDPRSNVNCKLHLQQHMNHECTIRIKTSNSRCTNDNRVMDQQSCNLWFSEFFNELCTEFLHAPPPTLPLTIIFFWEVRNNISHCPNLNSPCQYCNRWSGWHPMHHEFRVWNTEGQITSDFKQIITPYRCASLLNTRKNSISQ